jgi:hypothetical protein
VTRVGISSYNEYYHRLINPSLPRPMPESSDSDIEVVEVRIDQTPRNQLEFAFSEIAPNGRITAGSLKRAMEKYEIASTDDQLSDMVELLKSNNLSGLNDIFVQCGLKTV